jgi:hypothetical protein
VLFGDSVMKGQAPAIAAALDSTGVVKVVDQSFDGWGLTTDRTWRQNVPAAIEKTHAQVAVAMWSWDDDYYVAHRTAYAADFHDFVRTVAGMHGVAGLILEQFPVLGPFPVANVALSESGGKRRNAANDAWNTLARSSVGLVPGHVMYLPVGGAVSRGSKWAIWLPPRNDFKLPAREWVRVRAMDTVHFCPFGAARYAAALLADLTALFHLPKASPNWSTQSWAKNALIYEQPPGNCPNDHPS